MLRISKSAMAAAMLPCVVIFGLGLWSPPVVASDKPKVSCGPLEFSEKVVAGGEKDFMIVRHLKLAGTNRQIGKKLGEIAKTRHGVTLNPTDPTALQARREFYRRNYPNHFGRAGGVADAFGVTLETANVDAMELPFNLQLNAGCSTVYYPPQYTASGHATLSRNYDFTTGTFAEVMGVPPSPKSRAMTADVYVMEVYPDQGYPSLYLCAYDLLGAGLDGINSAGLTVAILAVDEGRETPEPVETAQAGLNEIEVPRFLLDTCATVEEAKTALMATKQYYSFIPCHYIIGDHSGKSFIWEYSAGHNREHITDGGGQPQIITNHPIYKYSSLESLPKQEPGGGSFYRFRRMHEEMAKVGGKHSLENMKQTNLCVQAAAPAKPLGHKPNRTLWHSLYDAADLTLQVDFYLGEGASADAAPRRSGYMSFTIANKK